MTFCGVVATPVAEQHRGSKLLRQAGINAVTAGDDTECLEAIRREAPGVLVVDAELPPGGAATVLDRVDGDPGVPWVPVTLVAGDASPAELGERFGLPPRCCLQKPIAPQDLIGRIRELAADAALPSSVR